MPYRNLPPIEQAEALLKRDATVPIEHLIRLIHAVNPTTRSLSLSDETRRYSIKAQLQSLLIRRFPERIRVRRTDVAGVVSLLHGYVGLDACHAVVDELEEDARAWVTLQLDLDVAGTSPNASEARLSRDTETDAGAPVPDEGNRAVLLHLQAGKHALKRYDYETATREFEEALKSSDGGIEPARALLGLWVEALGADSSALDLEHRLPKATLLDPDVRALLATAAARTGDVKRAERLTQGLENTKAAEVIAICAKVALAAGDRAAASLWLAQLRWLDAMHPELEQYELALQKLPGQELPNSKKLPKSVR